MTAAQGGQSAENDAHPFDNPVDDDGGRVPLFDPPICLCGLVTGACPAHPYGGVIPPAVSDT